VRSYRTFSPSPRFAPGLSVFCGTFRRKFCLPPACIAPEFDVKRLRGIAPFGVRTFLPAFSKTGESIDSSQFQKGLGDSPPFQNRNYHTNSSLKNQGQSGGNRDVLEMFLEKSIEPAVYCQIGESD
jgi:hypothetical protein